MYYVNDKQFKERCDAREYSWQLCREFSKDTSTWKIVTQRSTTENTIDSYAVYDIKYKDYVFEPFIIVD